MGLKICDFIKDANRDYFLPSIQREFVWSEEKIQNLFDSLLQEYPIGNIIIWEYNKAPKEQIGFEVYKFIEEYNEDEPHNKEAGTNGITKLKLILDGQQRLTSLLIGLKGKYITTHYRKQKKKKLYIDLFSDIENDPDNIYDLKYHLKFIEDVELQKLKVMNKNYWFEIGKVLDYMGKSAEDFKEAYSELIEKKTNEKELIKKAKNTLGQIHTVFCGKPVINIETVTVSDKEKILNIFVRTNEGGVKLEKADLLLSYMESNKEFFKPSGARKEITAFVDSLNKEEQNKPEYNLSKDDLLKAALVLSDIEVRYKLSNFNKKNLQKINEKWKLIKKYFGLAIRLLALRGFDEKSLVSKNAIIPLAYYLMKKECRETILNSYEEKDVIILDEMIEWFVKSILKKSFGSSSDSALEKVRKGINEGKPLNSLIEGKEISRQDIEELLNKEGYKSKYSHFILILTCGIPRGGNIHQDHIYSQKLLSETYLKSKGLNEEQIKMFIKNTDSIYNLQLLDSTINILKSDEDFIDWRIQQNKEYSNKMLIPDMEDYSIIHFTKFIEKRKKMMVDEICLKLKIK